MKNNKIIYINPKLEAYFYNKKIKNIMTTLSRTSLINETNFLY